MKQGTGALFEDERYFDCETFWKIAQHDSPATQKTKELALQSLIEILKFASTLQPQIKEIFIDLALKNIGEGTSVMQSITFLQNLLFTYPLDEDL